MDSANVSGERRLDRRYIEEHPPEGWDVTCIGAYNAEDVITFSRNDGGGACELPVPDGFHFYRNRGRLVQMARQAPEGCDGWSEIKDTEVYVHIAPGDVANARRKD